MVDFIDVVVAHGEGDSPGEVDDAPEEIGQDEWLNWPDDRFGSGNIHVLLAFHEVLDDFFSLVEVVDMPEIAVLKDTCGSALKRTKGILALLDDFIKSVVLCEYVNREESFLLEYQLQHALKVFIFC